MNYLWFLFFPIMSLVLKSLPFQVMKGMASAKANKNITVYTKNGGIKCISV